MILTFLYLISDYVITNGIELLDHRALNMADAYHVFYLKLTRFRLQGSLVPFKVK